MVRGLRKWSSERITLATLIAIVLIGGVAALLLRKDPAEHAVAREQGSLVAPISESALTTDVGDPSAPAPVPLPTPGAAGSDEGGNRPSPPAPPPDKGGPLTEPP